MKINAKIPSDFLTQRDIKSAEIRAGFSKAQLFSHRDFKSKRALQPAYVSATKSSIIYGTTSHLELGSSDAFP